MTSLAHDFSSLSTLSSCARKFWYQYKRRLRRPGVNMPMHTGTCGHAAFDVLYTQRWDVKLALEAFRDAWGDVKTPLEGKHKHLTRAHGELVLEDYVRHREEHPTMLEEAAILGSAEQAIVFQWPNADGSEILTLGGKPDLPSKFPNGQCYNVDHKWTGRGINDYWKLQFTVGHQLKIYDALILHSEGIQVDGGYINAVYMGKPFKGEWKDLLSVPNELFEVTYLPIDLEETWEWVKALQAEEKLWEEMEIWPQDEKACGNYGGCEFLELCAVTGPLRESRMSDNFQTWTPTGVLVSGADGSEEVR